MLISRAWLFVLLSCFAVFCLVEVVGKIEVGELLCNSLTDAPDSTLLQFAIGSNEVRGEAQGVDRVVSCTCLRRRYSSPGRCRYRTGHAFEVLSISHVPMRQICPVLFPHLIVVDLLDANTTVENAIVEPTATVVVQLCRLRVSS